MTGTVLEGVRLSPQQRGLWHRPEPAFRAQAVVRVEGALDVARLKTAVAEVVARHEVLRTTYPRLHGMALPIQVIAEQGLPRWSEASWADCPADEARARLRALLSEDRRDGGDLGQLPVLRASLIERSRGEHALVLTLPTSAADARSMDLLVAEVARSYGGEPGSGGAGEEPLPYANYSEWLNDRLTETAGEARARWSARRFEEVPPLRLQHAAPAAGGSFELASWTHGQGDGARRSPTPDEGDGELGARVAELARRIGVTPAAVLLACFQALLSRVGGARELMIGVGVDGRPLDDLADALGLFAHPVPVRARVPEGIRLDDLARACHAALEEARASADDCLATDALAALPLPLRFESRTLAPPLDAGGLRWTTEVLDVVGGVCELQLVCAFRETPGRDAAVKLELQHDPRALSSGQVERLGDALRTLIEGAAKAPEAPVQRLPLLGLAERQRLLVAWNRTDAELPAAVSVHEAFEAQVDRTPDAEAVRCGDQRLRYKELDALANQLAHHLRALGVGPDTPVLVSLERGVEMMIAVMGVLKAGGAFVPVDPTWPAARLSLLIHLSGAKLIVTKDYLAALLPPHHATVVCVDASRKPEAMAGRETWARLPATRPAAPVAASSLAYVIHTSGSTGTPKGVMITHRSVLNLREALRAAVYGPSIGAGEPRRVSMNAPLYFDASVKQIASALLDGHCLDIVPEDARRDARLLVSYLREHRIDVLDCTPSHLQQLVALGLLDAPRGFPSLVLVGGETIGEALWRTLAGAPDVRFYNVYGPTECTVDVTAGLVDAASEPNIGRALGNTRLYLLDADQQPAPLGAVGELYVAGEGVARGYVAEGLDEGRFVPWTLPDSGRVERLYRTGDRVRYLEDGRLVFVGRADDQVKLRGYRIELGEIQHALAAHPIVKEATVILRPEGERPAQILTFVVLRPSPDPEGASVAAATLRRHLIDTLPEYMAPTSVVLLESLPLTHAGKLDKDALLSLSSANVVHAPYVSPRNDLEMAIAAVWRGVLHVEQVGLNDNFFDLGGHSLLLPEVLVKLVERIGLEVPLVRLVEFPTVATLSAYLAPQGPAMDSVRTGSSLGQRQRAAMDKKRRSKQQGVKRFK